MTPGWARWPETGNILVLTRRRSDEKNPILIAPSGNWLLSTPHLDPGGGGNTRLRGKGVGGANSDDRSETLVTLYTTLWCTRLIHTYASLRENGSGAKLQRQGNGLGSL